jgi:hypothetical protein
MTAFAGKLRMRSVRQGQSDKFLALHNPPHPELACAAGMSKDRKMV